VIAAMNPCPCGYKGTPKCKCSPSQILKYQQRLLGPILDRIDIIQIVKSINFLETEDKQYNLPSAMLKKRVEAARQMQTERFAKEAGIHCNAQMTTSLMKKYCQLDKDSMDYLKERYQKIELSARKYNRMLRVARTIADLAGRESILIDDLKDAR
jgi:magnesium chelatase family protein